MSSFDLSSDGYDEALDRGLQATGESKDFFARERVAWTARRLRERGGRGDRILDFGCGTGGTTPLLREALNATVAVGTDPSASLLADARRQYAAAGVSFAPLSDLAADDFDLVYVNGVFHHIEHGMRPHAIRSVFDRVVRGGHLAFWENNPINPGTRYVMSRIPFDRDARMLWPRESRALLRTAGFDVLLTDYRFVFPRALRALRGLEPWIARVPIGGQYMVLARRPVD